MKYFWPAIILFVAGCSTKNQPADEPLDKIDTMVVVQADSVPVEAKNEVSEFDFTLDRLLEFDSEADLKKSFGDKVKRSIGYLPEDQGSYPTNLLFPGTKNEVEFVWHDTASYKGLNYIQVSGRYTDWKTAEGISTGTSLKELEILNGRPFHFYGFEWDYSGQVNWDGGRLSKRKLSVTLEYHHWSMPQEFDSLIGDARILSASKVAQKADPIVSEITMRR